MRRIVRWKVGKAAPRGARAVAVAAIAVAIGWIGGFAQRATPDPASPRFQGVEAIRSLLASRGEDTVRTFIEERVSPALRDAMSPEDLAAALGGLREEFAGLRMQGAMPEGEFGARVVYGSGAGDTKHITFDLETTPPHRFVRIGEIRAGSAPAGGIAEAGRGTDCAATPLTWETLTARLSCEAERGFSGAVLVVREGRVVLNEGYGFANREKKIRNTPETIFAIGSTPIDFTKAGILLLAERGRLSLTDPITKFFDKVPGDKKAITIDHLMTGGSGLRDFHDLPGDRDPDHAWIDRDEAVRRILAQDLLFAPGKGNRHSHSAWGLLAAVIEIVSGKSYQEFTRKNLFAPAGMKDTGFNGDPVPEGRLAIGYGPVSDGETNAPPYWGPASWLVLGSGGQISTTGDMLRWHEALRAGKILSPSSLDRYFDAPGAVLTGGDQYGYFIVYTQGIGSMLILISNTDDPREPMNRTLARDLAALVNRDHRPPWTMGIQLGIEAMNDQVQVTIEMVLPGGAGEKAGLRAGDVLVSANGRPLAPDPLAVIDPLLRTGDPIRLEIDRAGDRRTIMVTPARRP